MKDIKQIRLTKDQALIISVYTGVLLCDNFSDLHEYIEKLAGRPVFTHEMGNTKLMDELKEKVKPILINEIIYKKEIL